MRPSMAFSTRSVHSESDFLSAFNLMCELRPHLTTLDAFKDQIQRQAAQGYRLVMLCHGEENVGLAGYRWQENLYYGRFLYVDDLVISEHCRRLGAGTYLIDHLRHLAREQKSHWLVLDTGLANALAQRFYFRQGLLSQAMHFSQAL